MKGEIILILNNVRSQYNVGSLFRSAECVGIKTIYLTGYTPAPLDKFGREVGEITKTALGAEKIILWKKFKTLKSAVKELRKEDFTIVGIEQAENSVDYKKLKVKGNMAFILGNEVKGLSKKDLELCDGVAEIPLKGRKESLNVSVAGAIALFRILNV